MLRTLLGLGRKERLSRRKAPAYQAAQGRRLECEVLEGRLLPSFTVPSVALGNHTESANASAWNGRSVVAWTTDWPAGPTQIKYQVYDNAKNPVGGEQLVPLPPWPGFGAMHAPAAAMDANGNIAIAYTDDFNPAVNDTDVYVALFNPVGAWIRTDAVAITGLPEYDPKVAMDVAGDFVVSYTRQDAAGNPNIFFATGSLVNPAAGAWQVLPSPFAEQHSSVAMDPVGNYAIAFDFAQAGSQVLLAQFAAGFVAPYSLQQLGFAGNRDLYPSVAADNVGNVIVAWQHWNPVGLNWDVWGERVSLAGVPGGVLILETAGNVDPRPVVAMNRNTDSFAVAWYDSGLLQTWGQEFDAFNNPTGAAFFIGCGNEPAISIDGNGWLLITHTDVAAGGATLDIYGDIIFLP
jgi:hypothetical protein